MKGGKNLIALVGGTLYTPTEVIRDAVLITDEKCIAACGPASQVRIPDGAEVVRVPGCVVAAGFIDLHIHGLLGHDAMGPGLAQMIQTLPRYGVTAFLGTTIARTMPETYSRLRQMDAVLRDPLPGARCLGIHAEGPHLSVKRHGGANPAWVHPFTWEEFEQMQTASGNRMRMITFAPEDADSYRFIPRLIDAGVVPVIGHSDATYEQVADWVKLGLAHATHTFNAMSPMQQRAPGVVGAVLDHDKIAAQLIADEQHVHPAVMRVLFHCKQNSSICLISDAAPVATLPVGEYDWNGVRVVVDGVSSRFPDGALMGAHALLDKDVRNVIQSVGVAPQLALRCASEFPADAIGAGNAKGRLVPGHDADVVVLDADWQVKLTMVEGEVLWQA